MIQMTLHVVHHHRQAVLPCRHCQPRPGHGFERCALADFEPVDQCKASLTSCPCTSQSRWKPSCMEPDHKSEIVRGLMFLWSLLFICCEARLYIYYAGGIVPSYLLNRSTLYSISCSAILRPWATSSALAAICNTPLGSEASTGTKVSAAARRSPADHLQTQGQALVDRPQDTLTVWYHSTPMYL